MTEPNEMIESIKRRGYDNLKRANEVLCALTDSLVQAQQAFSDAEANLILACGGQEEMEQYVRDREAK